MLIFISIVLGISLILNVFLILRGIKLVDKIEEQHEYFADLANVLQSCIGRMKTIDSTGAFASDDEVGTVFSGLRDTVVSLQRIL